MVRYRLTSLLNKYSFLQVIFFTLFFALFATYIFSFSIDLFNVVNTATINASLIEDDSDLKQIDNYELDGTTAVIDGKKYEDVLIVFYGISTDDDTVYFNSVSNTLVQSLPENFGVSFLLSVNSFIISISLLIMTILLFRLNSSKEYKLSLLNKRICYFSTILCIILFVLMFLAFLVLC